MSNGGFMSSHGFFSKIGSLVPGQKQQYIHQFLFYPNPEAIAELAFNASYLTEGCLDNCPLEEIVSFDPGNFTYSKPIARFLKKRYLDRFLHAGGDSLDPDSIYNEIFPKKKFDLTDIDGNHLIQFAIPDIHNTRTLSHPKTVLWIDDVFYSSTRGAVHFSEITGPTQIIQRFSSETKSWIEARYTYS